MVGLGSIATPSELARGWRSRPGFVFWRRLAARACFQITAKVGQAGRLPYFGSKGQWRRGLTSFSGRKTSSRPFQLLTPMWFIRPK